MQSRPIDNNSFSAEKWKTTVINTGNMQLTSKKKNLKETKTTPYCTNLDFFFLSGIPQHCRFSCRKAGFQQSAWSSFVLEKKKKNCNITYKKGFFCLRTAPGKWRTSMLKVSIATWWKITRDLTCFSSCVGIITKGWWSNSGLHRGLLNLLKCRMTI